MTASAREAIVELSRPLSTSEPAASLVWFPCAGTGPWRYRPKVDPVRWSVFGYCPPGHDSRSGTPFARALDDLIEEASAALDHRELPQPVVYAGHSIGALVARGVAEQRPPQLLVICAPASPGSFGSKLPAAVKMSDRDHLLSLFAQQGIESGVELELLVDLFLPVLQADLELLDTWAEPRPMLDCDVLALYGADDVLSPADWTDATTRRSLTSVIPGDHFFPWTHPGEVWDAITRAASGELFEPQSV